MYDYEVYYDGICIDYIKADTDRKALTLAKRKYSDPDSITVRKINH